MAILSVTQLNRYVGFKLKEDRALQSVLVRGEITNFTNHYRSGHLYFTLRDAESCVKAVMFRSHAQRLKFLPQEGMNVIAAASAALYERDGAFQIYVTDLQPDGTGGKALVRPGTALVMQRLPRLPSLSDASMATGRLLSEASTSISSALRRTLIAFRNWRRLSAWMVARTSSCRLACTDCRACRKGSGLVERMIRIG